MRTKHFTALFAITLAVSIFVSCTNQNRSGQKAEGLIKQMTLDEKLDFIGGYQDFNIRAIERLGIPEVRFADGPVGVRNYGKSTAYPASITLAASFDRSMAQKTGKAIAMEARAKNVHVMLGPGMNIYRFPLCGRNFEYLGEDPYLAGQLAASYITGMQNEGVVATAKHYVANNQEFNRHNVSSDMDERTLHEIYLPAFKNAVQQGKVGAVMTSYNLINGIHASQNDYLNNRVLKGDWAFDGFIMSDWTSTYDGVACANGGLDLEMPYGKYMHPDTLRPALESGLLKESTLDDKIRRILNVYERFGFFEHPDLSANYSLDSNFVRQTALDAARGGMVLLKNEAILPLSQAIKSIAIIGPNGNPALTGGGGSSLVNPLHPLSLVEAMQQVAGSTVNVSFEPGIQTGIVLPQGIFNQLEVYTGESENLVQGMEAAFFSNTNLEGEAIAHKHYARINLNKEDLMADGVPEANFSMRFTGTLKPKVSAYYCLGVSGDDGYRLFIDGKKVIENWSNHAEIPARYECKLVAGKSYQVSLEFYQARGDAAIRFGTQLLADKTKPKDYRADALIAAQNADVVIMPVGFNASTESEGSDRDYTMPYEQEQLIQQIAQVNKNVVVVLFAGGNVAMENWIDQTKGLLHAWYPGQEGALAIAEILFGKTNPSGKLPASFEKKLEDNPAYTSYWDTDNDLRTSYDEGIFVGYRYYDKSEVKPRFPFGFGLSYTTFAFNKLQMVKTSYNAGEAVNFSVQVSNTGAVDGAEVVQVYVADPVSALERPEKELKAFEKVWLKAGESKTLDFTLTSDAFSYYNPQKHAWVLEPGAFDILVGNSSVHLLQKQEIVINE